MVLVTGNVMTAASADPLSHAISTSVDNNRQEAKVQQHIDELSDETRAMLEEYQRLHRELDVLTVYNDQLQRMVDSQQAEKVSIKEQMADLELTQHEILPLMLRMVQWLESFVQIDRPFLLDERRLRVQQLRALMDRADISIGEKYRRVLEAYQVEMEYGRTIEAYRGELPGTEQARTVDFLRIGRVGLYYQTLDRREVGQWNAAAGKWETLPTRYSRPVRDGLRMARKQAAPDLLRLPVAVPEEVQR
jgi:hypothetical protein